MSNPFLGAMAGRAAASIDSIEEDVAYLRQNWAEKVAQLSRDNERLKKELVDSAASATAGITIINAIVKELKEIEKDPATPRILTDTNSNKGRLNLWDETVEKEKEVVRVSISKVYKA